MNSNQNDIEFKILNKEYKDLTLSELKLIEENIKSEEEFHEIKQLLSKVESIEKNEITPNPAIKEQLIADFEQARWKKGITLKDTPVLPLPSQNKNKKTKYYSGFR